ncbi:MAG: TraR/DksA family transcriptional regulator [Bryobacteraceae bacterium]
MQPINMQPINMHPAKGHPVKVDLAGQKKALENWLADVRQRSLHREDLHIEILPDSIDQVQSATEREFAVRQFDQNAQLLRNLRAAIVRIDEGSYGVCESCDEPIPARRLKAVPFARLCVHCQEAAESHVGDGEMILEEAA